MRRTTRWCAGLAGVLVVAAVLPTARAAAEPAGRSDCVAPEGYVVNNWIGQDAADEIGLWTKNSNWDKGKAPGRKATRQVVCIRTAARVVLPVGAGQQVHVAAIDIGGGADVVVLRSNGLYVGASPKIAKSHVAAGSRLRLKGAALGGAGLIRAEGEVVLDAIEGRTNVLTTRECGAVPAPGSCTTPPSTAGRVGTLLVTGGGRLRVNRGLTLVTDGYDVVVAGGQVLMAGAGGRVNADAGTSLTLRRARPVAGRPVQPVLVFENDGGWFEGDDPFALDTPTRVSLNAATVAKVDGTETSTIEGAVTTRKVVRAEVQVGSLAVAIATPKVKTTLDAGTTYSTGSCSTPGLGTYACEASATTIDTEVASVTLPESAPDTQVSISEDAAIASATDVAIEVTADDLDVTRRSPAVLKLRYDASVIGVRTTASAAVDVWWKGAFRTLSDCTASGDVPAKARACVDRRTGHSEIASDGDLVMEVHTLHFSRWIIR